MKIQAIRNLSGSTYRQALRRVAKALAGGARTPLDCAARYGGEEFVLLLSDATMGDALQVAARLLDAVRALAIPHPDSPAADHVTMSIGVAALVPDEAQSPEDLLLRADQALYQAKSQGRNRAVAAPH